MIAVPARVGSARRRFAAVGAVIVGAASAGCYDWSLPRADESVTSAQGAGGGGHRGTTGEGGAATTGGSGGVGGVDATTTTTATGGTTTTTSSTTTTTTTGAGGSGGGACDGAVACNDCLTCASNDACRGTLDACMASAPCATYDACLGGCATNECLLACESDNPGGAEEHHALDVCLLCQECPVACDTAADPTCTG